MPTHSSDLKPTQLYRCSWVMVGYTLIVILWGAWVRISGSGDGCGDHWPLCNGAAIPIGSPVKTWIEVLHRYSTALFGLLILLQLTCIFRTTKSKHPARFWILSTLLFTLTEALIGRSLVKEGLVTDSESLKRLIVMPLHLLNTSVLIFSQVMTAECLRFGERTRLPLAPGPRRLAAALVTLFIVLLVTGAIAALGAHLLPAVSILNGLQQDFLKDSHLSVRLRVFHPVAGLLIPTLLSLYLFSASERSKNEEIAILFRHLAIAVMGAMVIGIATLMSLSPVWLKLLHLTMANVIVIILSRLFFFSTRKRA
jgi:cytochrome c oxidase assembly protein subunit 15